MACGLVLYGLVMIVVMRRELVLRRREGSDADSTSWALSRPGRLRRVPPGAPEAALRPVTVSRPVERDITDYADFTGRMAAVLDQKLEDLAAAATRDGPRKVLDARR